MEYISKLKYFCSLNLSSNINKQLKNCINIINDLSNHKLPNIKLSKLGIKIEDFSNLLIHSGDSTIYNKLLECDSLLRNFRWYIEKKFGIWSYINKSFIREWVKQFPSLNYLEVMAGNGIISKSLSDYDQQVICTDDLSWSSVSTTGHIPWTNVEKLDALDAIKKYSSHFDALIMSWSPYGNQIDWEILQLLRTMSPQPILFCIGEKYGATNSNSFWKYAKFIDDYKLINVNNCYSHFDFINDYLYLIK